MDSANTGWLISGGYVVVVAGPKSLASGFDSRPLHSAAMSVGVLSIAQHLKLSVKVGCRDWLTIASAGAGTSAEAFLSIRM